ncbi:MAG: thiamine pyrophosphate-dependent dehydrogenase E1 component subunit alpha [Bacteroidales bacterium]|nr:thiamine pyrophosphate-dependent dehydrogenase E1 component subunit alpha [Bacteroidales bacterium]
MLRIRHCEESLIEPILDGSVRCPVHLYSGQEAIAAGVCSNLEEKDYVFGNHRSHGHYLAKGGDMNAMVAEIYGKSTGSAKGRGGSMHLIDVENGIMGVAPIVAGTISLALGAALSSKVKKDNRVTVTFFGDGATGEGVLYESLNFASLKKLPVIFVCENNYYSTHLHISEIRTNDNISEIAKPFGMACFKVDGNNIFDVYEKSKEAVNLCRGGKGPVFMEFLTYRLRGHVGPDDNVQGSHTDIRPKEEIENWRKKDPLIFLSSYLLKNNIFSQQQLDEMKKEVEKEVSAAKAFAVNSEKPSKEELNYYVFKQ